MQTSVPEGFQTDIIPDTIADLLLQQPIFNFPGNMDVMQLDERNTILANSEKDKMNKATARLTTGINSETSPTRPLGKA